MHKLLILGAGALLMAHPQIYAQTGKEGKAKEPAAKAAASPLDNTRWSVKLTPDKAAADKGEKAFDDTLVFANGKVTMTTCATKGFAASPYTATKSGSGWTVKTEQTSATEGKTVWNGDITEKVFKGTMQWTKKDGSAVGYAVEGKMADKTTDKATDKAKSTDKPADKPTDKGKSGKSSDGKKSGDHKEPPKSKTSH